MHPLVQLAQKSVEAFIRNGHVMRLPESLSQEMSEKAGVFVCLKKHGQLRGCIGTIIPVEENVALETIKNAVSAATSDPRFSPVQEAELGDIDYSVDVLTPPEKIEDIRELDPKKYGVIVSSGIKKGLLLPDLEGVDTVSEQLRIAKMKAGIGDDEPADIFRFVVIRYR